MSWDLDIETTIVVAYHTPDCNLNTETVEKNLSTSVLKRKKSVTAGFVFGR